MLSDCSTIFTLHFTLQHYDDHGDDDDDYHDDIWLQHHIDGDDDDDDDGDDDGDDVDDDDEVVWLQHPRCEVNAHDKDGNTASQHARLIFVTIWWLWWGGLTMIHRWWIKHNEGGKTIPYDYLMQNVKSDGQDPNDEYDDESDGQDPKCKMEASQPCPQKS